MRMRHQPPLSCKPVRTGPSAREGKGKEAKMLLKSSFWCEGGEENRLTNRPLQSKKKKKRGHAVWITMKRNPGERQWNLSY